MTLIDIDPLWIVNKSVINKSATWEENYPGYSWKTLVFVKRKVRTLMDDPSKFNPIHRFFYGDPVGDDPHMYSTSFGDVWMFYDHNRLCACLKIEPDKDGNVRDVIYIHKNARKDAIKTIQHENSYARMEMVDMDDLVSHALRLVAGEISLLVERRFLPE